MSYPLATLGVTVDAAGPSAPSYNDIYQSLLASYRLIFGSDAYLEPDSQDGQMIMAQAAAINDCNMATIDAFNARSPSSAQGAALSSVVKINGIKRNSSGYSTVDVTIVGQAGTLITNGVVSDGYKWDLPASVTIPIGGSITVLATCQTAGAISAPAGTITTIATPTRGWQSVSNPAAATVGAAVEDDVTLRARQAVSTSLPAQTVIDSIRAAILNITGVTACSIHENDTKITDSDGVPGNSIAPVVEGGDPVAIATVISNKKTPGSTTVGTTTEVVNNASGAPVTINFYRPTAVPVTVSITIKALTGYVSTTGIDIQNAIANYVNGLGIGGGNGKAVEWDACLSAAKSVMFNNTFNIQSVTITGGTPDLAILFNEMPGMLYTDVTVSVV